MHSQKSILEILETSSKNYHVRAPLAICYFQSHPIDFMKLKASPSFLKASYMFPFFVGGFLRYHPLKKGAREENNRWDVHPQIRSSVATAASRLRLQRDEERFSDAAMRLFSDFDERKASLRLKKKGRKHRDYWVTPPQN